MKKINQIPEIHKLNGKRIAVYLSPALALLTAAFFFSACGMKERPPSDFGKSDESIVQGSGGTSGDPTVQDPNILDPADPEKAPDISGMAIAFDSLMLCASESGYDYSAGDPDFFWNALYYGFVNHGAKIAGTETDKEQVTASRELTEEFAAGLFADIEELPDIPKPLLGLARYEPDKDAYVFTLTPRGPVESEILEKGKKEDGTLWAKARLYRKDDLTTLAVYRFELEDRLSVGSLAEGLFSYRISGMAEEQEGISSISEKTMDGVFLGFSDRHTVEAMIGEDTAAFQVYDEEVLKLLSSLEEGAEFSFTVITDKNQETAEITEILEQP